VQKSTFLKMIWNKKDDMDADRLIRYPGHEGIFDVIQNHEKRRLFIAQRRNKLEAMLAKKLEQKTL